MTQIHPRLAPWPELTTEAQKAEFAACRLRGCDVDTAYRAAFLTDVIKWLVETKHPLAYVAHKNAPTMFNITKADAIIPACHGDGGRKANEYYLKFSWTWFYAAPTGRLFGSRCFTAHQWFDENTWEVTRIVALPYKDAFFADGVLYFPPAKGP
jgi:hypothetical protein